MGKDDKATIKNLRRKIENENRFSSAWRGYNKGEVNEYLQNIGENQAKQIEEERKKTNAEHDKNQQLLAQIQKMNSKIEELQNKLENRDEAEKSVVQKMMDSLKETNSSLMEENSRKKMEIARLEERIETMKSDVINYTEMLAALDKQLKEVLNGKISECNDLIDTWERQFEQTKEGIKEKMEG